MGRPMWGRWRERVTKRERQREKGRNEGRRVIKRREECSELLKGVQAHKSRGVTSLQKQTRSRRGERDPEFARYASLIQFLDQFSVETK